MVLHPSVFLVHISVLYVKFDWIYRFFSFFQLGNFGKIEISVVFFVLTLCAVL